MSDINNGITLSLRGLSRELGVDRTQLTERIRQAGIEPAGERSGYPIYRLRDVLSLILDASGHGDDPGKMHPADRLSFYRSENERIKLEQAQRQLVPIDECREVMATTFKTLALALETLPDRIEIAAGLDANQVAVMIQVIDAQRQMLYDSLVATD